MIAKTIGSITIPAIVSLFLKYSGKVAMTSPLKLLAIICIYTSYTNAMDREHKQETPSKLKAITLHCRAGYESRLVSPNKTASQLRRMRRRYRLYENQKRWYRTCTDQNKKDAYIKRKREKEDAAEAARLKDWKPGPSDPYWVHLGYTWDQHCRYLTW